MFPAGGRRERLVVAVGVVPLVVLAPATGAQTPAAAATGRVADSTGCSAGYVPEADPLAMAGVPPSCRPAGLEPLTDKADRDRLQGSNRPGPLRPGPARG